MGGAASQSRSQKNGVIISRYGSSDLVGCTGEHMPLSTKLVQARVLRWWANYKKGAPLLDLSQITVVLPRFRVEGGQHPLAFKTGGGIIPIFLLGVPVQAGFILSARIRKNSDQAGACCVARAPLWFH